LGGSWIGEIFDWNGVSSETCNLLWRGPGVTAVGRWYPWLVWKWWDSWGLWWAEEGGEGILAGVLREDGDVVVPLGLGGLVGGQGGGIFSLGDGTGGVGGQGNLGW